MDPKKAENPGLKTGDQAPDFSLPDQAGKTHKLSDYEGEWLLIYFYPKDDTPGCTKEACGMRENMPQFEKLGLTVLGISTDSPESHRKFIDKYDLNFTLLSDAEKKTVNNYGVWGRKKFMGREYMGTLRNSYLIDPHGKIAKVYESVKPERHAEEVAADLVQLKR